MESYIVTSADADEAGNELVGRGRKTTVIKAIVLDNMVGADWHGIIDGSPRIKSWTGRCFIEAGREVAGEVDRATVSVRIICSSVLILSYSIATNRVIRQERSNLTGWDSC